MGCTADTGQNRITYTSAGTQVAGAYYRPQATGYQPQPSGPFPAVLVLHSQEGLSSDERVVASWLAGQGYVTIALDYFTPIGVTALNFEAATFYARYTDRVREHLALGIECLKSLPFVDKQRIGVVGFSPGGYFGLLLGTRDDVKAVVSYYGAYHGSPADSVAVRYSLTGITAQVRASVLMLHGGSDTTVPLAQATVTHRLLLDRGKQAELVVYPDADHGFDRTGSPNYDIRLAIDARFRMLSYLTARLK